MNSKQPDAQGDAQAASRDDATVKHSDKTVSAGGNRGTKSTVKDPAGASSNETAQFQGPPTDGPEGSPTGMFDPATAHTMDTRSDTTIVQAIPE